jgi:hypothetical protein
MVGMNVMGDTVNRLSHLFGVGTKEVIIQHGDASQILVNILGVGAMIYAVVRGGVKPLVKYAQFPNPFCVNQEVLQSCNRLNKKNHLRR